MRKHAISILSIVALAVLLGAATAGEPDQTTIQSGSTVTEVRNGQTFEMTTVGVSVSVSFLEISEEEVEGSVRKLSGSTGTFTIRWVEGAVSTTIQLTPSQPEQLFGLEGGDGDKRETNGLN